jgi:secreted PhoX family phosphatase
MDRASRGCYASAFGRSIRAHDMTQRFSAPPFSAILAARRARRGFLKRSVAAALAAALPSAGCSIAPAAGAARAGFTAIPPSADDALEIAPEYAAAVLLRWGDPVGIPGDLPDFEPDASNTAAQQEAQAGMHHDGMAFFPLPYGSDASDHGLLAINHEYIDAGLLHPDGQATWSPEKLRKEQAAMGVSIVEVRAIDGRWRLVRPSRYARRITARTPCAIAGPAAGTVPLRTALDPAGREVLGTYDGCANGWTPWGTYLTCEENWQVVFANSGVITPEHRRYGVTATGFGYRWHELDERFDAGRHPNEPNRFGWVVEIDPFDPAAKPVKRTAMGRLTREGACPAIGRDRRMGFYMGDDQPFEYVYKFVTARAWDPARRAANRDLLDAGTLYVARFGADGTGEWLALVHGANGLTSANGFASQADVLVKTRQAADHVGATPMDRPEWCAVHPVTREVYVTLTGNAARGRAGRPGPDAANPRGSNVFGHIVRWREHADDVAATRFRWDIFALGGVSGNADPAGRGRFAGDAFGCPDGLWFDRRGVLWVQTDVSPRQLNRGDFAPLGNNQMLAADPATGEFKRFLVGPRGCEIAGFTTTPDGRTGFVNIQHPGEVAGGPNDPGKPRANSNWPDFDPNGRPRSATVVIRRRDGDVIGT